MCLIINASEEEEEWCLLIPFTIVVSYTPNPILVVNAHAILHVEMKYLKSGDVRVQGNRISDILLDPDNTGGFIKGWGVHDYEGTVREQYHWFFRLNLRGKA